MELTSHTISVEGVSVRYWRKPGAALPPLVLLHGFPGNHLGLLDFARALEHHYDVIVPDMPGCGQSQEFSDHHHLSRYSQWLGSFLMQLGLQDVLLVGHSFGARVAAHFAATESQGPPALVLVSPVVGVYGFFPRLAAWFATSAKILPEPLSYWYRTNKIYQYLLFLITFKSSDRAKLAEIKGQSTREIRRVSRRVYFDVLNDVSRFDLLAIAPDIHSPTLVIGGTMDEVAPQKSLKLLADRIPGSTLTMIRGTGHLSPIEKAQEVAETVIAWAALQGNKNS